MNIKLINELIERRYELKSQLATLEAQADKFYKDIDKNEHLMTPAEKSEKIFSFKRGYVQEKSELMKNLELNQLDIATHSKMPALDFANILTIVSLNNNSTAFVENIAPIIEPNDTSLQLGLVARIVNSDNSIDNPLKLIITAKDKQGDEIIDVQKNFFNNEISIFESDSTIPELISKVRKFIPLFKLNVDGGCNEAYRNTFNNWLAEQVRNYLGILPANKQEQKPTM